MVKLWLDDVRPAPKGWLWVKTVEEAKNILLTEVVTEASLDHDLGYIADPNAGGDPREPQEIAWNNSRSQEGADGIDLVKWMCEEGIFPQGRIVIHSWNPPGAKRMADTLKSSCKNEVVVTPFDVNLIGTKYWE